MEFIDDITDSRLAPFAGMRDAQLRGDEGAGPGLFIGESELVISRALDSGVEPSVLFMEEKWVPKAAPLIARIEGQWPECAVIVAPHQAFSQVTGYEVTRGPVAALIRPPLRDASELLVNAHRVAVLEDVMNATNIGAIFRSAAALGIDAVLLSPGCHDPLFRRAARVSMGTIFQVPWARIGEAGSEGAWTREGLPLLRRAGFATVAMALVDDAIPLDDARLVGHDRLAVVMGTEGEGLTREAVRGCDFRAVIPMAHDVDSLNVAAASAVAFWELRRR